MLAATPAAARADDATSPLTPGALALLLNGAADEARVARCREALAGTRPDSRATAARLARVLGKAQLVPDLLAALATETNDAAAREEMSALGWLAGDRVADSLVAAAARFEGRVNRELLSALAFEGSGALALIPKLRDLKPVQADWELFFEWVLRAQPDALSSAEAAWSAGGPEIWGGLLAVSRRTGRPLPEEAIARALREGNARVAELSAWHLLKDRSKKAYGPATTAAVAAARAAAPDSEPALMIALELVSRSLGQPAADISALLRGLVQSRPATLALDGAAVALLRPDEQRAYAEALFGDANHRLAANETGSRATQPVPGGLPGGARIRTAKDLPAGVLDGVQAASGCSLPSSPQWAGLETHFDQQGQLKSVGFLPFAGAKECEPAAHALLLLSALPADAPPRPDSTEFTLLPIWRDFAACAMSRRPPERVSLTPQATGGRIQEPRKVTNVAPHYPAAARNERRQGLIILEAVISPQGCIHSAEVLSGEHLDLAGEALRSVVQWRYTPTLLNGVPVPVVMTVTVNFKLQ